MASENTFQCSVVTPEKAVLECAARFVALPAHDGEIGILRGRAPMLYQVGIGRLRVETADGVKTFFVDGGFAQMVDNRLTILTEQARRPDELDAAAAREDLDEALALPAGNTERSFQERQNAIKRAREQLKMAS